MAISNERNPAWVAKAKSAAASSFFSERDEHRSRIIQIINELASAKGISHAWKSLERRFDDFEKIRAATFQCQNEAFRSLGKVYASLEAHELQRIPTEVHVHFLADICFRAYDGFKGFAALSAQEQTDRAEKVAKQARELAKTLAILAHPIFGIPEEFDLGSAALDIHQTNFLRMRNIYADENLWNKDWQAGYCAGGLDFARVTANELPTLLSRLAEGAEAWRNTRPPIAKPNSKDAHRTYFVKCLTSYFVETYGAPMHAAVLAFTGVFFDISTLTKSSVIQMTTGKRGGATRA